MLIQLTKEQYIKGLLEIIISEASLMHTQALAYLKCSFSFQDIF